MRSSQARRCARSRLRLSRGTPLALQDAPPRNGAAKTRASRLGAAPARACDWERRCQDALLPRNGAAKTRSCSSRRSARQCAAVRLSSCQDALVARPALRQLAPATGARHPLGGPSAVLQTSCAVHRFRSPHGLLKRCTNRLKLAFLAASAGIASGGCGEQRKSVLFLTRVPEHGTSCREQG